MDLEDPQPDRRQVVNEREAVVPFEVRHNLVAVLASPEAAPRLLPAPSSDGGEPLDLAGAERRIRIAQVDRRIGQGAEDVEVVREDDSTTCLPRYDGVQRLPIACGERPRAQRTTLDGQISRKAQKLHER